MVQPKEYFRKYRSASQKKYEALREYYLNNLPASVVAEKYGYTQSSFYSLLREFKAFLKTNPRDDYFFKVKSPGKRTKRISDDIKKEIISLRKEGFSIQEIKSILDARGCVVSESYCYRLLKKEGFQKLKKRKRSEKTAVKESVSISLDFSPEAFQSSNIGILLLIPYVKLYGIDKIINDSILPDMPGFSKMSIIMSFLALKLSKLNRQSSEELFSMDRGLGLFAGLSVLPRPYWFTSYSEKLQNKYTFDLLVKMHSLWLKKGLLGSHVTIDTINIPCWRMPSEYSKKQLTERLLVFSYDSETEIIDLYKDPGSYPDLYREAFMFAELYGRSEDKKSFAKYMAFDYSLADHENLGKLNRHGIRFYRFYPTAGGKTTGKDLDLPLMSHIHLYENSKERNPEIFVYEEKLLYPGYNPIDSPVEHKLRHLNILYRNSSAKVSILTNDFFTEKKRIAQIYFEKYLNKKPVKKQIMLFHLNKDYLSMDIDVRFDFLMTVLSHNIYRLFIRDMDMYMEDEEIFDTCLSNAGRIEISAESIKIILKKRKNLDIILSRVNRYRDYRYEHLGNKRLVFDSYLSS